VSLENRILERDSRVRWLLYAAVGSGFFAAAALIAQIWLLSSVVGGVFLEGKDLSDEFPLLTCILVFILLRAGLLWAGDVISQYSASLVKGSLRSKLAHQLFALGPAFTRTERSGELANTILQGVETLDEYIAHFLPARLLAGLVPALIFLVVLFLDPWTTLVLLFAGPMLLLLLSMIGHRTKDLTDRRFLELSWLSAHFLDMLQGLTMLKMFGRSKEQVGNIEKISNLYEKTTMEVLRTAFQTSLVMEWAATAATAMVALEVSLRLMNGDLQFNRALAVLLCTPEFFLPIRQMALKYHAGTAGRAAAQRIFAILDLPPKIQAPLQSGTRIDKLAFPQSFDLEFDEVSFSYSGMQQPALEGFSLKVQQGDVVALVGPTGSGKTTLANILLRFMDPGSGTISIGGLPLQAIERSDWLSRVAWVPQLPYLFYDTVANNICLARPDASLDEVVAAARAANAEDFILKLPRGYDTSIGERGARLSGGEQQRIAIARAFLKDAPFLILDEATSHLDSDSESLIREAVSRLMQGRTVLIIAHSMEFISSARQILVMEQGRIVQSGSHQDLMASTGLYQRLQAAFEGETK